MAPPPEVASAGLSRNDSGRWASYGILLSTVFLASFWLLHRTLGASPILSIDTFIENQYVGDCLANRCTPTGLQASVLLFHSAGYLYVRTFLAWLELNLDQVHVLLLALTALGVSLTAFVAHRAGGSFAAVVAALVCFLVVGPQTQLNVVTDLTPMPFLGAVFLAVAWALFEDKSVGGAIMLGLVGAVMADTYATGALCFLSVPVLVARPRPGRWIRLACALTAFGATTFLLTPGTWMVNGWLMRERDWGAATLSHPALLSANAPLQRITVLAALGWIGALLLCRPARRLLEVPAAVLIPVLLAVTVGSWTGRIGAEERYFAGTLPAVAVMLGVLASVTLQPLRLRASSWATEGYFRSARSLLQRTEPLLPAVSLFSAQLFVAPTSDLVPEMTAHDLEVARQVLIEQRHWAWPQVVRNLKVLDQKAREVTRRWGANWPAGGEENSWERAYLFKVPLDRLPSPLPENVVVIPDPTSRGATLLVFACASIDWSHFEVCTSPEGGTRTCQQAELPLNTNRRWLEARPVSVMPPASQSGHLELRLSLMPHVQCAPQVVAMRTLPTVCPGRVLSIGGGTAGISDAGHRAVFSPALVTHPGTSPVLVAEWRGGEVGCSTENDGYPPVFLEGDRASVDLIWSLLPVMEVESP